MFVDSDLKGVIMLDRRIDYFITVAQEGSFSAASRKFFLSQANLSKQISNFEEEIGVCLFDRSGYKPVLTDVGTFFYEECLKMNERANEILNEVAKYQQKNITIGFTGAFENRQILDAIIKFRKENEGIQISINKYSFNESVLALQSGTIDISFGLESTFERYKEIKYDILHPYDICLICAHDHPFSKLDSITIDDLKHEELIVLSKTFSSDMYREFMESCRKDGFSPIIKKEVDFFDELVFSVSIGEGVAIVARNVVRENEVKTIDIENTHHSSNYVIAYLDEGKSPVFDKFVNKVKEYFKPL